MKKILLLLVFVFSIPLAAAAYSGFNDVFDGDWYAEAVSNLHETGIIEGYSDGSFQPGSSVNRAELAVMLDRMMTSLNVAGYGADYSEEDTGVTLYLSEGETFKVKIEDVSDGGYDVEAPTYDADVLYKRSLLDVAPEFDAGDGADGYFVYSFEAVGVGETDLSFTISRGGEDSETVFEAHVVVE